MTIERTRELLGEDIKDLSDSEVLSFIQKRSDFCDILLEMIEANLLTSVKEKDDNE